MAEHMRSQDANGLGKDGKAFRGRCMAFRSIAQVSLKVLSVAIYRERAFVGAGEVGFKKKLVLHLSSFNIPVALFQSIVPSSRYPITLFSFS